jgi:hypothetical protein
LVVAAAWIAKSSFVVVFFSVCVCVCFFLGLADAALGGGLLCESCGDLGFYIFQRGFWVWSF